MMAIFAWHPAAFDCRAIGTGTFGGTACAKINFELVAVGAQGIVVCESELPVACSGQNR